VKLLSRLVQEALVGIPLQGFLLSAFWSLRPHQGYPGSMMARPITRIQRSMTFVDAAVAMA
jgi:hypothetical protein